MDKSSERAFYRVSQMVLAHPNTYAVFLDPDSLEQVKSRVVVWASLDWYTHQSKYIETEVVGLSSIPFSINLALNEPWKENFVCYIYSKNEDIDEELLLYVENKIKKNNNEESKENPNQLYFQDM